MTTRATADETGSTLVEIVVVIALTGVAVAMLLGSLATAVKTSSIHRTNAVQGALVSNAAEILADPSTPYVPCATVGSYADALPADPDGATTLSIVKVAYWAGNVTASFSASCSTDTGVQLIKMRATSNDGKILDELEFTKRRSIP